MILEGRKCSVKSTLLVDTIGLLFPSQLETGIGSWSHPGIELD